MARQFEDAISCCDRYLQTVPNSYEAYRIRADAYYQLDNLEQAKQDCDRAIQYNPYCQEAYRTRAKIFRRKSDYLSAKQDENQIKRLENLH